MTDAVIAHGFRRRDQQCRADAQLRPFCQKPGDQHGAKAVPHDDAVGVAQANGEPLSNVEEEAISALLALGYKPQQAATVVSKVAKPEMKVEALIREALRAML